MLSCFVIRQIKYNASLNYTNLVLVNGRTYLQISLFFIGNNGGSISIKSQNARLECKVPLYSQLVRMYSNQISKIQFGVPFESQDYYRGSFSLLAEPKNLSPQEVEETRQIYTKGLEPVCCKKRQKSPNQETDLGSRGPLEALIGAKLILND